VLPADAKPGLGNFREYEDRVGFRAERLGGRHFRVELIQRSLRLLADLLVLCDH
jgi:hypothetical protein